MIWLFKINLFPLLIFSLLATSLIATELEQIRQYENLKKQEQGELQFSKIIQKLGQTPKDPSLHFELAEAYRLKKLFELAKVSYERSLKLKPDQARAHLGLSLVYRGKQEETWELYHLEKAALLAPESAEIRFKLGRLYMEPKAFNYRKAKKEYKALKKMNSPLATKLGRVMELE